VSESMKLFIVMGLMVGLLNVVSELKSCNMWLRSINIKLQKLNTK